MGGQPLRAFEVERIERWRKERSCRTASMEKSMDAIAELDAQILELTAERDGRRDNIGSGRTGDAVKRSERAAGSQKVKRGVVGF